LTGQCPGVDTQELRIQRQSQGKRAKMDDKYTAPREQFLPRFELWRQVVTMGQITVEAEV
jgi:hypothetical protein